MLLHIEYFFVLIVVVFHCMYLSGTISKKFKLIYSKINQSNDCPWTDMVGKGGMRGKEETMEG